MTIRKAKLEDFESYFALEGKYQKELNKFAAKPFKVDSLDEKKMKLNFERKVKQKNKLFLLAEESSKVVGYFFGEISTTKMDKYGYKHEKIKYGYIENVFIEKKYRGKGIFKEYLDVFEKYLKKQKIKSVHLHVSSLNPAKITYEKLGFKEEEIKMFKTLS